MNSCLGVTFKPEPRALPQRVPKSFVFWSYRQGHGDETVQTSGSFVPQTMSARRHELSFDYVIGLR